LKSSVKVDRKILIQLGNQTLAVNAEFISSGTGQVIDSLTGEKIGTITINNNNNEGFKTVTSQEVYNVLFNLFPWLKSPELNNVMVAGGSISTIIQRLSMGLKVRNHDINDVDLFMYGLDPVQCKDKVAQLINKIKTTFPKVEAVYTQRALTLFDLNNKIQIILTAFASPSQILQSFDLPSSMVGVINFQDPALITTSKGFFSLTNRVNIVNPKCHSELYAERLTKYFYRGYSIAFPDLNLKAIKNNELIMPWIRLTIKPSCDNKPYNNQLEGHPTPVPSDELSYAYDDSIVDLKGLNYFSAKQSIERFMSEYKRFASKVSTFRTAEELFQKIAEVPRFDPQEFRKYIENIYKDDVLDLKIFEQIPDFNYKEFMKARKMGPEFIESYLYSVYYGPKTLELANRYRDQYAEFAQITIPPFGPDCHLYTLRKRDTTPESWYGEGYQPRNNHCN
jgi:hypothetical protein